MIVCGCVLEALAALPDGVADCCVTSPPYWSIRDYKIRPSIFGGVKTCAHEWESEVVATEVSGGNWSQQVNGRGEVQPGDKREPERSTSVCETCTRCGAWRGQLGLEPTPELYVEHIVEVFDEVRRVLKKDGTLWVNIGDSYITAPHGKGDSHDPINRGRNRPDNMPNRRREARRRKPSKLIPGTDKSAPGLKRKDLVGVPWMVAFALRRAGWWLRTDIVWEKPNAMPEAAHDRPTRSHEMMFLLSRSYRYYYDQAAVRLPGSPKTKTRGHGQSPKIVGADANVRANSSFASATNARLPDRNLRTVWTIHTQPYGDDHYATFPEELAYPCVKAGSRAGGVVLDPFGGTGTVGRVARSLGRRFVMVDISLAYCLQARSRVNHVQLRLGA